MTKTHPPISLGGLGHLISHHIISKEHTISSHHTTRYLITHHNTTQHNTTTHFLIASQQHTLYDRSARKHRWKLIDLDAACEIGKEPVGHKSSSAYVPPEAIYVDPDTNRACVRTVYYNVVTGDPPGLCFHLNNLNMLPITTAYDLLVAQPSFDVWSLGCILYQMCSPDVRPLFQGTAYLTLTP